MWLGWKRRVWMSMRTAMGSGGLGRSPFSPMSRSRSRVSLDFFVPCASFASSRRSRSRSRRRSCVQHFFYHMITRL